MFKCICLLVLVGMASGFAANDLRLDNAQVTLSFRELQRVLATTPVPPAPLIASAILSATYTLDIHESFASGSATFVVQTFGSGDHLVPLFDESLIVRCKEDVILVVHEGRKALLVAGPKRIAVTIDFSLPTETSAGATRVLLRVPKSAVGDLRISTPKVGASIAVANAFYEATTKAWLLSNSSTLDITMRSESAPTPVAKIVLPAVIREATSQTRVVRDGATLNTTTWKLVHGEALLWKVQLPDKSKVVACLVNERPASPSAEGDNALVFSLPESETSTDVTVSYTAQTQAFEPVRGDFALTLPTTDLLIERLDWKITLPPAFEPIALEGNADTYPSEQRNEILLRKELLRGAAASVRVFYQKPETTKKP